MIATPSFRQHYTLLFSSVLHIINSKDIERFLKYILSLILWSFPIDLVQKQWTHAGLMAQCVECSFVKSVTQTINLFNFTYLNQVLKK